MTETVLRTQPRAKWFPALAVLTVLVAFGCDRGAADPSREIANEVQASASYDALPVGVLSPHAPLCARSAERCLMPRRGFGAVSPAGDAVVGVPGGRGVVIVLVRAGSDSAIRLGREGSGPGEYRLPVLPGFAPDGDVLLIDILARRTLRYAPDGETRATGSLALPPAPLQATGSLGGYVDGILRMLSADRVDARGDTLPMHVFALAPDAAPQRLHELGIRLPAHAVGEMLAPPVAFAPTVLFVIRADGTVVLTTSERLVLTEFPADGRRSRQVGFDVAGRAVTEDDLAALRATRLRGVVIPDVRAAIEQRLAQAAARHPAITELVGVGDGVWVRRTPRAPLDSVEWVEFDSALRARRRVSMAVDDAVIGRHGDRLLVARLGDDESSTGYWWMTLR